MGAKEGAPSPHALPDDGGPAEPTGFAFSPIHSQGMLKSPARPAGIHISADSSPADANGLSQDVSQAMVKPEKGFLSQGISPPPGVDSSAMESLIGINVSHPGQELLVQKERFNRPVL